MKNLHLFQKNIFFATLIMSLAVVGCDNDESTENSAEERRFTYHDFDTLNKYGDEPEKQSDIELDKPIHSQITKYQDSCPKLLQKQVDSSLISRNHEFLHGKYCDYYIYPKVDQKISIDTYGANVKTSLIMPMFKPLDNSFHIVEDNSRHVIRVEYDGVQNQPNEFVYDITVDLKDDY